MEMTKIGEDILVNSSEPRYAYHQKMYPTSIGLLFFQNASKGRFFLISVKIFLYKTAEIKTIKEFSCESYRVNHIYLFEEKEKETIVCKDMDDLVSILNNKFLLLWIDTSAKVIKLDRPDKVLFEHH